MSDRQTDRDSDRQKERKTKREKEREKETENKKAARTTSCRLGVREVGGTWDSRHVEIQIFKSY